MPASPPDARDIRNLTNEIKELRKAVSQLNSTLVIIERRRTVDEAVRKLKESLCSVCLDNRCQSDDNDKFGKYHGCPCCASDHDQSTIRTEQET